MFPTSWTIIPMTTPMMTFDHCLVLCCWIRRPVTRRSSNTMWGLLSNHCNHCYGEFQCCSQMLCSCSSRKLSSTVYRPNQKPSMSRLSPLKTMESPILPGNQSAVENGLSMDSNEFNKRSMNDYNTCRPPGGTLCIPNKTWWTLFVGMCSEICFKPEVPVWLSSRDMDFWILGFGHFGSTLKECWESFTCFFQVISALV